MYEHFLQEIILGTPLAVKVFACIIFLHKNIVVPGIIYVIVMLLDQESRMHLIAPVKKCF